MSTETTSALNIIKQAVAQLPLSKWEDREIIRNAVVHIENELSRNPVIAGPVVEKSK
jgi:hypothetical protein